MIVTAQVNGTDIHLDVDTMEAEADDSLTGTTSKGVRNYERWRYETYTTKEPDTLEWIDTFLKSGEVLYDIGANIGQYSLYAAKRVRDLRIFAFEPESLNFAKLNRNIVANDLSETVTACCTAVTDKPGADILFINKFTPAASLHTCGRPVTQGEAPFAPQHRQGVLTVSLDSLVELGAFPFPTHLKIDVDGLENAIVDGAARTLSDSRLRSVLIEIYHHKDVASHVEKAFEAAGMKLHNADAIVYEPGTVQNFIFVRE